MVQLDSRRIGIDAITSEHVKDLEIKPGDIAAGAISNVKVADDAAIAGSKISPNVTNAVIGVGAGYKIARGKTAVTGEADIATGLMTVVQAIACLEDDAALAGDVVTVADSATSGNIVLKVWKRTAANDCTPAAATVEKSVRWIAIGT